MSTELAERLLNEKKRDLQRQKYLVKTLRSNASILLKRRNLNYLKMLQKC